MILRSVLEAGRLREQLENYESACTQVLFTQSIAGIFSLLEIVTGWLVPSITEDPTC